MTNIVEIQRLGVYGEGVGNVDGLVIFVESALPGELVKVRITQRKKTYARGELIEIIRPSKERVKPICPIYNKCGGCQIMHLNYQEQLKCKRQRVVDSLERIAKIKNIDVMPCVASPLQLHYRNKIQLKVAGEQIGLYARGSHDIVPIDHCYIHCEQGEEIFQKIAPFLRKVKKLNYVLIKTARNTKQTLIVLVTSTTKINDLKDIARQIGEVDTRIEGVVLNVNNDNSNAVLGNNYQTLYKSSTINEDILGIKFKISGASFFQVNPEQAANIYRYAIEGANLTKGDTILDAYCGVGTLSLLSSSYVKRMIGIESVEQAIDDAKLNSINNDIDNVTFILGKSEDKIRELQDIDLVFTNPPRKGCDEQFLESLVKLKPSQVVYISCNPETLARDLKFMVDHGYSIDKVCPFDMFPQTMHVETVVHLKG